MKRGSSFRFIEWPMPLILASVLGWLMVWSPGTRDGAGSLELAHFLGRVLHGPDDVDVAGAAAEVSGDGFADFLLARVLVALEQCRAGHHHARRAEPTLQRVLLGEALLHGMELAALLQAFDGGDLRSIGLHRQHGARLDRIAVHDHRAGAAMRGVAADVGPRHAEHFADEVHQEQARLDFRFVRRAVDGHADLVPGHGYFPPARCTALRSARAVSTRAISRLYSTEPRRSAPGALFAAAIFAASPIVLSSGTLPARNFAASPASTGVTPALVRAIPARSTAPLPSRVNCTAAAATAKSPVLRFNFA